MTERKFVGLEIHDRSLWEPSRVLPIIDTMQRWGYNALVLHQNDLLDDCSQLFLSANYGVSDLRLKKVRNNVAWLNLLVDRLAEFDARLFLEIKEPSFHNYVLERYPELLGSDGMPDPTRASWFEFCRDKVSDLLTRVPGLGGLIVNISSPESGVSLPDHLATSKSALDLGQWFDEMISAFYQPLAESGKELLIRDFSYTTDMQSEVLSAVDRKLGKVGASIKITAHDYFPGFPENPVARTVSSDLIFEFEAFGEHMGWGVIPNCRVQEFQTRMIGYREIAANGILIRTSWEAITGANALDCLSAVNVYALPKLIEKDIAANILVSGWLREEFGVEGEFAERAVELLLESWNICSGIYWHDEVFPRHSCLPSTWQEGWISMITNGMGSRNQDVKIDPNDPRLTETARLRLFKEKEDTTKLAKRLASDARELSNVLPTKLARQFDAFANLPVFAQKFELATKATFYAARGRKSDLEELLVLHSDLLSLASGLEMQFNSNLQIPHHHAVLFDPEQIRKFAASLYALLD